MFKVTEKETSKSFDVFDITYDAITGYPQFLIYKGGQWLRVSAKRFEPYEDGDPALELLNKWETEELKKKYDSDSRPRRRNKAFEELQKQVEDFVYDLHMGNFKED